MSHGSPPADAAENAILVVDDDPGVRHTIQWALEDEGLPVDIAADGHEALERVATRRPALVLLDMGLPSVDGYGVASGLRERHGPSIPIVVITADGRAAFKARRVGAVDYVVKPFDIDDLISTVRRVLASSS